MTMNNDPLAQKARDLGVSLDAAAVARIAAASWCRGVIVCTADGG